MDCRSLDRAEVHCSQCIRKCSTVSAIYVGHIAHSGGDLSDGAGSAVCSDQYGGERSEKNGCVSLDRYL